MTPGPVYQVPSTVWDLVWMVEQLCRKLLGKEQAFQFHMQDDEMIAENWDLEPFKLSNSSFFSPFSRMGQWCSSCFIFRNLIAKTDNWRILTAPPPFQGLPPSTAKVGAAPSFSFGTDEQRWEHLAGCNFNVFRWMPCLHDEEASLSQVPRLQRGFDQFGGLRRSEWTQRLDEI